jgi:hypothetical protein
MFGFDLISFFEDPKPRGDTLAEQPGSANAAVAKIVDLRNSLRFTPLEILAVCPIFFPPLEFLTGFIIEYP